MKMGVVMTTARVAMTTTRVTMTTARVAMTTARVAMTTARVAMTTPRVAMTTARVAMTTLRTPLPKSCTDGVLVASFNLLQLHSELVELDSRQLPDLLPVLHFAHLHNRSVERV